METNHTKLPWHVVKLRRKKDGSIFLCSVEADEEFIADSQLDACDSVSNQQN